jgi:hypothetical protein
MNPLELNDEQKQAFAWIQSKLESVEALEREINSLKAILKNLIQITDNVAMLAPYRKSEAYGKIKEEILKIA